MNTEKEKTLEVKVVNNKDNMTSNTNAMIYTNTSQIGNTSIRQPNTNEPISIAKVITTIKVKTYIPVIVKI